jgi:hypothetical protein
LLAYLFWHRPRPGVEQEEYEEAQRQFHALLEVESACFWVEQLPFGDGAGYEDWYLVEDWQGLGELNAGAVDARRKGGHDRAAGMVAEGGAGSTPRFKVPSRFPRRQPGSTSHAENRPRTSSPGSKREFPSGNDRWSSGLRRSSASAPAVRPAVPWFLCRLFPD